MDFGSIQSLLECWTEDLGVFLAVSQRPSSVLCHVYLPHGCWLPQSQQRRGSLSKNDISLMQCDHEVTSQHLCHISLVKQVTSPSHSQGEGITEGYEYKETGLWELPWHLSAILHRQVGGRQQATCHLSEDTQSELTFEEG